MLEQAVRDQVKSAESEGEPGNFEFIAFKQSFLHFVSLNLCIYPINKFCPSGTEEEDDLDEYITENRETKSQRNQKMAKRVQTVILQDLWQVLGVDTVLPKNAAQKLILQVQILTDNLTISLSMLITQFKQFGENHWG